MKATNELISEHKPIKLMLSILGNATQRINENKDISAQDLASIVDFFKGFADKCHHSKEEEIFFPALLKRDTAKAKPPIDVLLTEHASGRQFIGGMQDSLSKNDLKAFATFAKKYIALLSAHIDKENNVLFVLADSVLDDTLQDSLFEEFEKIEIERIGLGKHEEYHALIKQLKRKYL